MSEGLELAQVNKKIWLVKARGHWLHGAWPCTVAGPHGLCMLCMHLLQVESTGQKYRLAGLTAMLFLTAQVPNSVAQAWRPLCEQAMNPDNLEDDDSHVQLGTLRVAQKEIGEVHLNSSWGYQVETSLGLWQWHRLGPHTAPTVYVLHDMSVHSTWAFAWHRCLRVAASNTRLGPSLV